MTANTSAEVDYDRSFDDLFRTHAEAVHRFCYCAVGSRDAAEDLLAETFFRAYRHRQRLPAETDAVRRWLLRVARNLAIDHHRRVRRQKLLLTLLRRGSSELVQDPHDAVADRTDLDAVLTTLVGLSPRDRTLIALRVAGELTHAEIAAVTHSTAPAVQMGLQRARARLRARSGLGTEDGS